MDWFALNRIINKKNVSNIGGNLWKGSRFSDIYVAMSKAKEKLPLL